MLLCFFDSFEILKIQLLCILFYRPKPFQWHIIYICHYCFRYSGINVTIGNNLFALTAAICLFCFFTVRAFTNNRTKINNLWFLVRFLSFCVETIKVLFNLLKSSNQCIFFFFLHTYVAERIWVVNSGGDQKWTFTPL